MVEIKVRPLLQAGMESTQESRRILIRTAVIFLASLEVEISYLLSDQQTVTSHEIYFEPAGHLNRGFILQQTR